MTGSKLPLCVDCDGTLIRTDLLHESILLLLKRSVLNLPRLLGWLWQGKAQFKHQIAELVQPDVATLPYNEDLLKLIHAARAEGRMTVLATAAASVHAHAVASHLSLFDRVEASDATVNLSGRAKADRLVRLFGARGYDYAGDSRADIPVWQGCDRAIVVGDLRAAGTVTTPDRTTWLSLPRRSKLKLIARALRVHQWLKNILVFVPAAAAHTLNAALLVQCLLAFLAFSLCASAVYVVNDLLDLPADRKHARKRHRPFASGALRISAAFWLIPLLLGGAAIVSIALPRMFELALLSYFLITCAYSFWLKNRVVLDIFLLATLYTMRIVAGAAATHIQPSFWLLGFSMFIFLSLAIVKRYTELRDAQQRDQKQAAGRAYTVDDLPVLLSLGTAASYLATLILALYINSPEVSLLYHTKRILWLALPPFLYWTTRLWVKTHRGEVHDDPVVFAATDRQSWAVAALMALAGAAATVDFGR